MISRWMRLCAIALGLAEVTGSLAGGRDVAEFRGRLEDHFARLNARGVNDRRPD